MNLKLKKNINLDLINNFLLFDINKLYYKNNLLKYFLFYDKIKVGNIVFVESFYYDLLKVRKQFFLGLCIAINYNKLMSNFILKNVLKGFIIEQGFFFFNPLLSNIRSSKLRYDFYKKSKLYFIVKAPYFFKINKLVLNESFYYLKGNKLKKNIKIK